MPRIVALVILVALTAAPIQVVASHVKVKDCTPAGDGGGVDCRLRSLPHRARTTESPPTAPAPPPDSDILYRPILSVTDDRMCITMRREVFPGAAGSRRASEAESLLLVLLRTYRPCEAEVRPAATPAVVAREVIEHIDLPAPDIEIDPGHAITGNPAYLETKGLLHPGAFVRPTPLGEITVDADGEYVVDWGDASPTERYGFEGEAWPDGRISHVYTDVGRYDVVVTVEWVAHWVIGERRGTVSDLRTSDRIEDFEVRQLQAVRNR